jgi:hypothetical protein
MKATKKQKTGSGLGNRNQNPLSPREFSNKNLKLLKKSYGYVWHSSSSLEKKGSCWECFFCCRQNLTWDIGKSQSGLMLFFFSCCEENEEVSCSSDESVNVKLCYEIPNSEVITMAHWDLGIMFSIFNWEKGKEINKVWMDSQAAQVTSFVQHDLTQPSQLTSNFQKRVWTGALVHVRRVWFNSRGSWRKQLNNTKLPLVQHYCTHPSWFSPSLNFLSLKRGKRSNCLMYYHQA